MISKELDKLNGWFAVNKLSLNVSKTNFIIFGNKKQTKNVDILINGEKIDRVYVTKFLGVIIDHKLNWKEHIEVVKNKISKSIAIIHKASKLLNTNSLYTLYCSLFLPYLNYCAEIWGNTYITNLNTLILKQKRVIRIICKAGFKDHTNPLFKKMKILKLVDLIKVRTAMFMFKADRNTLPRKLQSMFVENKTNLNYNFKHKKDFYQRYVRTKQKMMCTTIVGIKLWNSLDINIKNSNTLDSFKTKYKGLLINMY